MLKPLRTSTHYKQKILKFCANALRLKTIYMEYLIGLVNPEIKVSCHLIK